MKTLNTGFYLNVFADTFFVQICITSV